VNLVCAIEHLIDDRPYGLDAEPGAAELRCQPGGFDMWRRAVPQRYEPRRLVSNLDRQ
jgi:hypothetical protein